MKTDNPLPEHEPEHAESSTAYLLQEMALYGYRPYSDEPDDRPLPDARAATGAIIDIFDAMISTFIDTRSDEHTSELQSLMRLSYADFCLTKHSKPHLILLITTKNDINTHN